jgi:hypothetical protein
MRIFSRVINEVKYWLQGALIPPPSQRIYKLIDHLRKEMEGLPELPIPTSGAEAEWLDNRKSVREFFRKRDPRQLFSCDTLTKTMVVGDAPYTSDELAQLRADPLWSTRWESLLAEPLELKPQQHFLLPSTSGNTIHHTYHIKTFEEKTKLLINDAKLIIEFGGGYGNLCRLIHKLGFTGKYIIFDLPEFSLIQEFYLGVNGLEVQKLGGNPKTKESQIFSSSDIDELISEVSHENIDLFLATWSLSEVPLGLREKLIPFIRNSQNCFFAYQDKFQDVDNLPYFSKLGNRLGFESWECEISFLPGNHYQILSKRI